MISLVLERIENGLFVGGFVEIGLSLLEDGLLSPLETLSHIPARPRFLELSNVNH